jgi:hypothetical protein
MHSTSDFDRPKSAKSRLLEAAWAEMCAEMERKECTRKRLERLRIEAKLASLPIKQLAAIWLDFQRTGSFPEGF